MMSRVKVFQRPMRREHQLLLLAIATLLAAIVLLTIASRVASAAAPTPGPIQDVTYIVSPASGVFYAGDYPGGRPHVEIGQEVTPETIVGTIESMGMVSVRANVWGTVTMMLVPDGALVSAGQPLYVVRQGMSPSPMR